MKKMHFTSSVACTALALFGAAGHALANASESSPISAVSTQASAIAICQCHADCG
ncbi:hypothetical protein ACOB3W_001202 [Vibrio cholerae]